MRDLVDAMIFTLSELANRVGSWSNTLQEYPPRTCLVAESASAQFQRLLNQFSMIGYSDRVVVQTDASIQCVLAMLAIWHRGGAVIPVDLQMPRDRLQCLTQSFHASFIFDGSTQSLTRISERKAPRRFATTSDSRVTGSDLALIIPTSGSTGFPKGVMLTHLNVIYSMYSIERYLNLTTVDRILCVLPLSFDYGLYQALFALLIGCSTILYRGAQSPFHMLAAARDLNVTVLPVVPSFAGAVARILCHSPELRPMALRIITNTAGHLPSPVIETLRAVLPHTDIYAMYGLTECKRALYLEPSDLARKPGSVGRPIPGVDARVFRPGPGAESAREPPGWIEAGPDEVGQLFVRGPNVMQGYTSQSDCSSPVFSDQYRDDVWLATGDLFYRDVEGFFYFVSRQKDLIKQDGFSIVPTELESTILRLDPDIQAVCVVSDNDADTVEIAHAFIEISNDHSATRDRIGKAIGKIERRLRPRKVSFLARIPLNSNGKVDRARLFKIER